MSKALIDLYISQDKFVLVDNVLKSYDDIKEELINLKTSVTRFFNLLIKNVIILFEVWKKYRE